MGLFDFFGFFGTIYQHPVLSLLTFLAVLALLFKLLGGNEARVALKGIGRIVASYFTAPFRFLQHVLAMFKKTEELEQPFRNTRQHLLFQANRLQYVAIVICALLWLSGGVVSALIALYPRDEIASQSLLSESLAAAKSGLADAQKKLEESNRADFLDSLKAKSSTAQAANASAIASRDKAVAALKSGSTGLNVAGATQSILQTESIESAEQESERLQTEINEKCTGWTDYNEAKCNLLVQLFAAVNSSHQAVLESAEAATAAASAVDNAAQAHGDAQLEVLSLTERVRAAQVAHDENSLLNFSWLKRHVGSALKILITTFLSVIGFVWIAAIGADIFSWLILMMLALEKRGQDRLRKPDQGGDGPQ